MDLEDIENQPADDEYERFSQGEDFEDYKVDGYHPVQLGETYNQGQYKIIQKLGWGQFSTVWMAKDQTNQKFYALKIQKSKKSYGEAALDELQLLKDLQSHLNDQKWKDIVVEFNSEENQQKIKNQLQLNEKEIYSVTVLDNFTHFGMHGKHYCSVFDVMGPTLLDIINHFEENDAKMEFWLVKLITRQILVSLIYMHEVCNMIHTDLKPENVMISLDEDTRQKLIEHLQKYDKKPISMKFLYKLQSSNSEKNKKKYDKKKKKKQQKKAEELLKKDQDDQPPSMEISQVSESTQATEIPKQISQNKYEDQKTEENDIVHDMVKQSEESYSRNKECLKSVSNLSHVPIFNENEIAQESEVPNEDEIELSEKSGEEWVDCTDKENLYNLIWKNDMIIDLNRNSKFKLVDFGNACWTNKHFTDRIQTREYRAPEAILQQEYFPNTDVWSLGCLVFEMLTNMFLFKPYPGENYKKNDDHLCLIQETLGKFSKNFALSGKRSREFFNKNGQMIKKKPGKSTSIQEQLIKEYKFKNQDAKQIEAFLKPLLEVDTKKRISAREALKSEWLWS